MGIHVIIYRFFIRTNRDWVPYSFWVNWLFLWRRGDCSGKLTTYSSECRIYHCMDVYLLSTSWLFSVAVTAAGIIQPPVSAENEHRRGWCLRACRPEGEKITGHRWILHDKELHSLYCSLSITKNIKLDAQDMQHAWEVCAVYTDFRKAKGERQLGRSECRTNRKNTWGLDVTGARYNSLSGSF
jgi:hypothetical protein